VLQKIRKKRFEKKQQKMEMILIDADASSLTVSWPAASPAASDNVRYVLQYRKASDDGDRDNDGDFETLSETLTTTQARKKNLTDPDGRGFVFRARSAVYESSADGGRSEDGAERQASEWVTHRQPFRLLSADEEKIRMAAPTVRLAGSNETLLISWKKYNHSNGSAAYELQMRENKPGMKWNVIASSLSSVEVRKKNLKSKSGYQFRIRPIVPGNSSKHPFSPPSDPYIALGLSAGLSRLFESLDNGTLLRNVKDEPIPLAEALGGKEFVLLYASAHWCGPCRQFTPSLSQWYNSLGAAKTVDVVFLSADHDKTGFRDYYSQMPWLAVDYDDDAREELMSVIRVTGIPRLAVVDGRSGRIIEDNAVGKPLDVARWRSLAGSGKK